MELQEAILVVIEAGLTVENDLGGWIAKNGKDFRHQRSFRSTDDYSFSDEAISAFLNEAGIDT